MTNLLFEKTISKNFSHLFVVIVKLIVVWKVTGITLLMFIKYIYFFTLYYLQGVKKQGTVEALYCSCNVHCLI